MEHVRNDYDFFVIGEYAYVNIYYRKLLRSSKIQVFIGPLQYHSLRHLPRSGKAARGSDGFAQQSWVWTFGEEKPSMKMKITMIKR